MESIRENLDLVIKIENALLQNYREMAYKDEMEDISIIVNKKNLKDLLNLEQEYFKRIASNPKTIQKCLKIINIDNNSGIIDFSALASKNEELKAVDALAQTLAQIIGIPYVEEIHEGPIEQSIWDFPENGITTMVDRIFRRDIDFRSKSSLAEIVTDSPQNLILIRIAFKLLCEYFSLTRKKEHGGDFFIYDFQMTNHRYYCLDNWEFVDRSLQMEAWLDDYFFSEMTKFMDHFLDAKKEFLLLKYLCCFVNPYVEKEMITSNFHLFGKTQEKEDQKFDRENEMNFFNDLRNEQAYYISSLLIKDLYHFYKADPNLEDPKSYLDINFKMLRFSSLLNFLDEYQKSLLKEKIEEYEDSNLQKLLCLSLSNGTIFIKK